MIQPSYTDRRRPTAQQNSHVSTSSSPLPPPHPFTPQISNNPPRPQFLTLLHPAQAQHPNTHRLQTAAIRPTTKKGSRAQSSYVRIQ